MYQRIRGMIIEWIGRYSYCLIISLVNYCLRYNPSSPRFTSRICHSVVVVVVHTTRSLTSRACTRLGKTRELKIVRSDDKSPPPSADNTAWYIRVCISIDSINNLGIYYGIYPCKERKEGKACHRDTKWTTLYLSSNAKNKMAASWKKRGEWNWNQNFKRISKIGMEGWWLNRGNIRSRERKRESLR